MEVFVTYLSSCRLLKFLYIVSNIQSPCIVLCLEEKGYYIKRKLTEFNKKN